MRHDLNDDIVREVVSSAHLQDELDREWRQMCDDREAVRNIFPKGEDRVRQTDMQDSRLMCHPSICCDPFRLYFLSI